MESTAATVPLSDLQPGEIARVVRIGGRCELRRRFLEMGFTPGEEIVVERVAPLGDPVEFVIRGYHISLRKEEARDIHVRRAGYAEREGWGRRRCRRDGECGGRGRRHGRRRWRIW